MADAVTDIDTRTRWEKAKPWLWRIAFALAPVLGALAAHFGVPPRVVEVLLPVLVPAPFPQLNEFDAPYSPTQGWVKDDAQIAANLDDTKTLQFAQTPAGKALLGDDDVFLWQAVRKVNNRGPPWYSNVNQQSVGCCVGCGFKHAADVVQAVQILGGSKEQWKPLSVECIYGASRIDIGRGQINGDGSLGRWAADAVQKVGCAPMEKIGAADLTTFSPARAREYGSRGVPADVKAVAKDHPVKGAALVTSWADAKRAIGQGYPIAVCSDQGFTMQRDATGRCRPQGQWMHCMAIIGTRAAKDGRAEGGFILNSWGDSAHTGPVWPADAPVAGFWADAAVIDRMLRQGDSFALSGFTGFPKRVIPLNWDVRVPDDGWSLYTKAGANPLPFTRGARFIYSDVVPTYHARRMFAEHALAP